jgi:hypothetical protein
MGEILHGARCDLAMLTVFLASFTSGEGEYKCIHIAAVMVILWDESNPEGALFGVSLPAHCSFLCSPRTSPLPPH